MRPKIGPLREDWISFRRTGLAKAADSKPRLLINGCFDALQPCYLKFVEVRVRLAGEVKRDLFVKREQFVRVSQQISQSIFCRPKPVGCALISVTGRGRFAPETLEGSVLRPPSLEPGPAMCSGATRISRGTDGLQTRPCARLPSPSSGSAIPGELDCIGPG
jgi:hypothetical protein